MTILYHRYPDGGFLAGDTDTGRASYAYPSSPHATRARLAPDLTARKMCAAENDLPDALIAFCPGVLTRNAGWIELLKREGKSAAPGDTLGYERMPRL